MHEQFTCPQGHRWESGVAPPESEAREGLTCPVCGMEAEKGSTNLPRDATTVGHDISGPDPFLTRAPGEPSGLWTAITDSGGTDGTQQESFPLPALSGYEVLGVLGQGGMGIVYMARQLSLKRTVALKTLLAGAHANPSLFGRFRAEAEAVARLQHPNIVQIYEVGQHHGCPYFALEYVEGGSLAQRLRATPPSPRLAAQWILTLAQAVHYAHERGIIHRDLKPANVLLAADGTLKITDFGLAKQLAGSGEKTRTGEIFGTPSYMAPEQASGVTKGIGPAADVYALGAVLYEMLTGRPPFLSDSAYEIVSQVLTAEPVRPRRLQPGVPRDLETICLHCLNKEPRKRYTTAQALADDLQRFLAGEPIRARPAGAAERLLKWAKRRPALAALLAVSLVALLLVLGGVSYYNVRLSYLNQRLKQEAWEKERQRDKAQSNLELGVEAIGTLLRASEKQLQSLPQTSEVRRYLLEAGRQYYEDTLARAGMDPQQEQLRGLVALNLGSILNLLGRTREAGEAFDRAFRVFQEAMANSPSVADREHMAYLQRQRGMLLFREKTEEAEAAYRQSCDLYEKLATDYPDNLSYQLDWSTSLNFLGRLYYLTGKRAPCEKTWRRAVEIARRVVEQAPKDPQYHFNLAMFLHDLGDELRAQPEKWEEARQDFEEAIHHERTAVVAKPSDNRYRQELANLYESLAEVLFLLGKYPEGSQAAEELPKLFPESSYAFYRAAVLHGECVTHLQHDKQLPVEERATAVEIHAHRAIELLRQAQARGFADSRAVRDAASFQSFHSRAEFQELVRSLEQKGNPPGP